MSFLHWQAPGCSAATGHYLARDTCSSRQQFTVLPGIYRHAEKKMKKAKKKKTVHIR